MLTHLYSAHIQPLTSPKKDEERSTTNGHAVVPNAIELEGLMSDDEDAETAAKHRNGRPM
jgi:hypothetical protein